MYRNIAILYSLFLTNFGVRMFSRHDVSQQFVNLIVRLLGAELYKLTDINGIYMIYLL